MFSIGNGTSGSIPIGGTNLQVQFNLGGALAGVNAFTFNPTNSTLSITAVSAFAVVGGTLVATNQVEGSKVIISGTGTDQIVWGATNSVPSGSTNTAVLWVPVIISGSTNQYRMPLYQ